MNFSNEVVSAEPQISALLVTTYRVTFSITSAAGVIKVVITTL